MPQSLVQRSQYPHDAYSIDAATHSFQGNIVEAPAPMPGMVTKIVDGAVRVTTVTDDIRQRAVSHWNKHKTCADVGIGCSSVVLICGAVAAIVGVAFVAAAAAEAMLFAGLGVLGAAAAVSLVALIALCITAGYRGHAKGHLKSWKDPALQIAQHRQKAAALGYPYLRKKNDLRNVSFAPAEKTGLAMQTLNGYLDRYNRLDRFSERPQTQFIDEFFTNNPLDGTNHFDAFGSDPALEANMRAASAQYQTHVSSYRTIVREASQRRGDISRATDREMSRVRSEHTRQQMLLQTQRDLALMCIRQGRPCDRRRSHRSVSFGYTLSEVAITMTYNSMIARLDSHYERVYSSIRQTAAQQTALVNDWESARKLLFVRPVGQILEAFVHGRDLDLQVCRIEPARETPPPTPSTVYVFPSLNVDELNALDDEGIFDLTA